MKYNVSLPEKYETSTTRYPVLYLLHGYSSNYLAWNRLGAPRYARAYDLIVVMPDVGNSWYGNWAKSEGDQKNDWEDFVVKDLVSHVDSTYRTVAAREGRAINGLSMGGYGALMLGLKHPDMFCSIGSQSGALGFAKRIGERLRAGDDLTKAAASRKLSDQPNPAIGIEGFTSQVERTPKGQLFATPEQADADDPFKLVVAVSKDKLPHISIDCGTDDRLLKSGQDFVKLLMDNKIPFTYAESAGGHIGAYWSREVGHAMAIQYHILRRNMANAERDSKAATP
jgi:S-formylglutathione hydrolase FrmB